MWPFARKSTPDHEARLAIQKLADELQALKASHVSLRGRVYATGQHKAPEEAREPTKAEVLRQYWTPGQPAKHT